MVTNRLVFRRMVSWVAERGAGSPETEGQWRDPAVVREGFVFDRPPRAMNHASSIAASGGGLVAAWFGGSLESRPDVGIWVAVDPGGGWSAPVEVATGVGDDGTRLACWNPVLFQPAAGPLLLFYKVGANPRTWWGLSMASEDGGRTWTEPRRLPEGVLGPIKNKPVQLANGDLLSPSSTESDGWRVYLERSADLGRTWRRIGPLDDGGTHAIQPSILSHGDGRLQLLCRSKQGFMAESWSSDGGDTWSPLGLTPIPNPNSGCDAVTLADGRQLLVYNRSSRKRSPLNVAISRDGKLWNDALVLARGIGEYSYPAVIQAADGLVHVTYSWNLSRIKHVVIDPMKLAPLSPD
jgi:predicted neuraminidase